jgi:hypothetical protein
MGSEKEMTTNGAVQTDEVWDRARYQAAIQEAILRDFEGLTPEELQASVSKTAIYTRMDFPEKWEVGKSPGEGVMLLALFDGERVAGDIVAYVFPTTPVSSLERFWSRYTLSRVGAVTMVERMPRETFVEELADEWAELLGYYVEEEEEEAEETEVSTSPATPSALRS